MGSVKSSIFPFHLSIFDRSCKDFVLKKKAPCEEWQWWKVRVQDFRSKTGTSRPYPAAVARTGCKRILLSSSFQIN